MRFSNLTVLVTGGAGGLGSALVRAFAKEGGRVLIADIDEESGNKLVSDISETVEFMRLDVTDEGDWRYVLDSIDSTFGGLDILVNNAGFFQPNISFEEMPLKVWKKHFSLNSDSVFLGCKHGIQRLKQRGGAIVNMGSSMSIKAHATSSAYCASKAAVLMTTRTAAISAASYNIRVNALLPGPINTRMLMTNLVEGQSEEELLEQLANASLLRRLTTPEDVASAVLFLADPASSMITGTHLCVDGGNMSPQF